MTVSVSGVCWTRIVVWWSVFTVLTGLASGFAVLVVTRFLFGVGEAGGVSQRLGQHSPLVSNRRACEAARRFVWGASRVWRPLTPFVVVPLMLALGWRTVFFLFGALGLVWAVACGDGMVSRSSGRTRRRDACGAR